MNNICHTSVTYVIGKTFSDRLCHLMQYLQFECTHRSNHGLELCSCYWFRSVFYFLFSCFSAGIHLSDRAMWCYYFWPTHGWELGLGSLVALPRLINSKIYPTKTGIMDIWHQTDMKCTMHQTEELQSECQHQNLILGQVSGSLVCQKSCNLSDQICVHRSMFLFFSATGSAQFCTRT